MVQSLRQISPGLLASDRADRTRSVPSRFTTRIWLGAIVFYCVADLVTSAIGLSLSGIGEIGPIASMLYHKFGFLAMVPLKIATVTAAYGVWRVIPDPHDIGVPLGLSVVGVLVTAWNLSMIVTTL